MNANQNWQNAIQEPSNNYTSDHLEMLLFNYCSPQRTECVFLFDDMTFKRGTVVDVNPKKYEPVLNNDWCDGCWILHGQSVKLRQREKPDEELLEFEKAIGCFILTCGHTRSFFYPIDNTKLKKMAIMFLSQGSAGRKI